jgi:hypothetical protein
VDDGGVGRGRGQGQGQGRGGGSCLRPPADLTGGVAVSTEALKSAALRYGVMIGD